MYRELDLNMALTLSTLNYVFDMSNIGESFRRNLGT